MPTERQIIEKNLKKKKRRTNAQNAARIIKNTLIVILAIVTTIVTAMFVLHTVQTKSELQTLTDEGLYNLVEIEDGRKMNVAVLGDVSSGHTLVTISDVGVQDFTVFAKHFTDSLSDKMAVAFVDRAGYGFSDDSDKAQTVDQIINDYRAALAKANVQAPYILMAHEFGGVYATHWALNYPDEIEGIVYLNGTELLDTTSIEEIEISTMDKIYSVLYKLGFQRIKYYDYYSHYSKVLGQEEAVCSKALNVHSVKTMASLSEASLMKINFNKVMSQLKETDMPKLYLSVDNGFATQRDVVKYFEYKNEQNAELGLGAFFDLDISEEAVAQEAASMIKYAAEDFKNITLPFAKKLGNCHVAKMPGDNKIYEQKPEAITEALGDFLLYIDGKLWVMKDVYDDSRAIDWEKYKEELEVEVELTAPTHSTEPAN